MFSVSSFLNSIRRSLPIGLVKMAKGKYFYAVKTGKVPGVYGSWEECKKQVDKFPSATFKKFASEEEALTFVGSNASEPTADSLDFLEEVFKEDMTSEIPVECSTGMKRVYSKLSEEEVPSAKRKKNLETTAVSPAEIPVQRGGFTYMGNAVVVYTDGCCSSNGYKMARAGIGVYWGPDHPKNVAERLTGRQTNQRAEILAACRAIEQAKSMDITKIVLYTDSMFTINGITKWIKKWKTNGWKLNSGGSVTNKDDFQKLDKATEGMQITWIHIPGHAGYQGNEEADRLAREGATKPLN
ncbi:ribonuclease H1 [Polypterus senegalus]|uniref:ribonuclease H1 n=1 Tax=Polypterus senegalus TaxID=55291 RepID=UPI001963AB38|nr:ribonuclease H1 [Polypterus senegalus]